MGLVAVNPEGAKLKPKSIVGNYIVRREIRYPDGTSSRGAYTARHVNTGRKYVIKSRYTERERKILFGFDHPNIVKPVEVIDYRGDCFLVLSYAGPTIEKLSISRSDTPFTDDQLYKILRSLLLGLCAIHSRSIAHRDLHTGNVAVSRLSNSSILDFGSAVKSNGDSRYFADDIECFGSVAVELYAIGRYLGYDSVPTDRVDGWFGKFIGCVRCRLSKGRRRQFSDSRSNEALVFLDECYENGA